MKKAQFFSFLSVMICTLLFIPATIQAKKPPRPPSGDAPSAPTGLAAVLVYPHDVQLDWNLNPETDIAGYNVYRNTSRNGKYQLVNQAPVPAPGYLDQTVAVGTTYYFKVSAINTGGTEGKKSSYVSIEVLEAPDNVPPGDPSSFSATAGDGEVLLSWVNPDDEDVAGTAVRFSTTTFPLTPQDGTLVCDRAGSPGSSDSFLHGGLANGQTYYYTAFAHDMAINFSDGVNASATPIETVPLTCADCHGYTPPEDYFTTSGHGRVGIDLACETCHYGENQHQGSFGELREIAGYTYPAVAPDAYAAVLQRRDYCALACHVPSPPGSDHPNGYDYISRYDIWTFIEILSPGDYVQKYGVDPGTILPSQALELLDVDLDGVNSYGDIVMCTTCHKVHGSQSGYFMTPLVTGPDDLPLLCTECHLY